MGKNDVPTPLRWKYHAQMALTVLLILLVAGGLCALVILKGW